MKRKYEPKTLNQKLAYLVEECGEVVAATGKTLRWGIYSFNPELPLDEQETNIDWVLREIKDLKGAIERVEKAVEESKRFKIKGTRGHD